MKTVSWTDNPSWGDVLRQAGEEDVLVLRNGHPVVLMTPFDEDDLAWYARARPGVPGLARQSPRAGRTRRHGQPRRLEEGVGSELIRSPPRIPPEGRPAVAISERFFMAIRRAIP